MILNPFKLNLYHISLSITVVIVLKQKSRVAEGISPETIAKGEFIEDEDSNFKLSGGRLLIDLEGKIKILKGDITDMDVDAVVNAANTNLLLGSGVAGAIRKQGGDSIQKECDRIGSIPLGEAAITGAGSLKSRFVIHAAGMHIGGSVNEESLRAATKNSLMRADEKGIKTIAFPAIGTGVGGFPVDMCAEAMIDVVSKHLESGNTFLERVYFVLFDELTCKAFNKRLKSKLSSNI